MNIDRVYDFQLCEGLEELSRCISEINRNKYILNAVTQDSCGSYTVFFCRMVVHG